MEVHKKHKTSEDEEIEEGELTWGGKLGTNGRDDFQEKKMVTGFAKCFPLNVT